jgi:hypothetical protein
VFLIFIDFAKSMPLLVYFVCLCLTHFYLIGMKCTNLGFIDEHRVYSLTVIKGTATMLFLMHNDQTVDSMFKEVPLDAVIERFAFPLCLVCTIACSRPSQISTLFHGCGKIGAQFLY